MGVNVGVLHKTVDHTPVSPDSSSARRRDASPEAVAAGCRGPRRLDGTTGGRLPGEIQRGLAVDDGRAPPHGRGAGRSGIPDDEPRGRDAGLHVADPTMSGRRRMDATHVSPDARRFGLCVDPPRLAPSPRQREPPRPGGARGPRALLRGAGEARGAADAALRRRRVEEPRREPRARLGLSRLRAAAPKVAERPRTQRRARARLRPRDRAEPASDLPSRRRGRRRGDGPVRDRVGEARGSRSRVSPSFLPSSRGMSWRS